MDYVCTWKLALLGPTGQMREILGCLRDKPDVPTSWSHWLQVPGNGGETEVVSVKRNRERRQCPWLLRELPFKRGRSCRTGKSGWRSECFGRKRPHLRLPLTLGVGRGHRWPGPLGSPWNLRTAQGAGIMCRLLQGFQKLLHPW